MIELIDKSDTKYPISQSDEKCYKCGLKALYIERDFGKIETGKYLCKKHYYENYDRNVRKFNPDSNHNIVKALTGSRTGFLNPKSNTGKAIKFQKLTCRFFGVKDLNLENDNYCSPIDHSRHTTLGILQTQGRFLQTYIGHQGGWNFSCLEKEWAKEFDHIMLWCADKNGIERGYIIPKNEIISRKSISIVRNPSRGIQWYEQYRITDEKILKEVNGIWQKINGESI